MHHSQSLSVRCIVHWLFLVTIFFSMCVPKANARSSEKIIVHKVTPDSLAETAGIKPGDRLVSWKRLAKPPAQPKKAKGKLNSIFDWYYLELEQNPRGIVLLKGLQGDQRKTYELPSNTWGLEVRPNLPQDMLSHFEQALSTLEQKQFQKGISVIEKLVEKSLQQKNDELACWLLIFIGDELKKGKKATDALHKYREAQKFLASEKLFFAEAELWERIGDTYQLLRKLTAARAAFEQALTIREKMGQPLVRSATTFKKIGTVMWMLGKLDIVEESFRKALKLTQQLAPVSMDHARNLNNLGALFMRRGDNQLASQYLRQAQPLFERLAPGSMVLANVRNNLGLLAEDLGNHEEALNFLKSALTIYKEKAPLHKVTGQLLYNIGRIHRSQGDFQPAEHSFLLAQKILLKADPEGTSLVVVQLGIAAIKVERGEIADALKLLQRCHDRLQSKKGHTALKADILFQIGDIYIRDGLLDEAEEYFRTCFEFRKKNLPNSIDLAASYHTLATVAFCRGQFKQCETQLDQAFAIYRQQAPQSIGIARCLKLKGDLYRQRGYHMQAEEFMKQALTLVRRTTPYSPFTIATLTSLGIVSKEFGNLKEALDYFHQAEKLQKKIAPQNTTNLGIIRFNLASIEILQNNLDAALTLLQEGFAYYKQVAPDGMNAYDYNYAISNIYYLQKKYNLSIDHATKALSIIQKLAPDSTLEVKILYLLGHNYRAQNNLEKALDYYQKIITLLDTLMGHWGGGQEDLDVFSHGFSNFYRNLIDVQCRLHQSGANF